MKHLEKIVPIILAAGPSKLLPFPKALAKFGRKTALAIAVENCKGLERPLVVLGCQANRVRRAIPEGARTVLNRNWREGQLSSLQTALQRLRTKTAFLIYPVDQPLLERQTMHKLVRTFHTRKPFKQIVMPQHKRTDGHPVIVSGALRKEFFQAATAREVIYREERRIRRVEVSTKSVVEDFHSEERYRACLKKFLGRKKRAAKKEGGNDKRF